MIKTAENLGQITTSDELPKLLLNINIVTDRLNANACVDDLSEKWKTEVAYMSVDGFNEINEAQRTFVHQLIN